MDPALQHRLETYAQELLKWNHTYQFISPQSASQVWERHILDSLRLLPFLSAGADGMHVVDIGSGGGLPVVPLACALPDTRFYASDVVGKKLRFLEWTRLYLELSNLEVLDMRDASVRITLPCVVTSRAFGSVDRICNWCQHHAPDASKALLFRGANSPLPTHLPKDTWRVLPESTVSSLSKEAEHRLAGHLLELDLRKLFV